MHASLHDSDVEAERLRDLRVRSPFDVAKHALRRPRRRRAAARRARYALGVKPVMRASVPGRELLHHLLAFAVGDQQEKINPVTNDSRRL